MMNSLKVKVVCSTAWYLDSQGDVLTDTSYDASIAKKGKDIPHILDHRHSAIGHVGDVLSVYTEEIPLKTLGYASDNTTTALIMETNIREDYNPDVYKFYKNGKINQHSIGLSYVEIKMAFQSSFEEDKEYNELWEANIDKIINKEDAVSLGYFFLVEEIDLLETSCVLFGANSLTPTLDVTNSQQLKLGKGMTNTNTPAEAAVDKDAKIAELEAEVVSLKAQLSAQPKDINGEAKTKAAYQAATDRALSIISAAKTFNLVSSVDIEKDLSSKLSADELIDRYTWMKEQLSKQTAIESYKAEITIEGKADTPVTSAIAAQYSKGGK